MVPKKFFRQFRHELHPQPPEEAQADGSAALPYLPQPFQAHVQAFHGLSGIFLQVPAIGGQSAASAAPLKKRYAQFFFQFLDGVTEGGLGNAQSLRRMGIMLLTGQFQKITQLGKIHRGSPPFFSSIA